MPPRQYPAIVREALANEAEEDRLQDAVAREVRLAVAIHQAQGEEAARQSLGEEIWGYTEARLQGFATLRAAALDMEASGLVGALAAHLRKVWSTPGASLVGKALEGSDPVLDGRGVGLIFVQEWASRGVIPPIHEVRGIHIRQGVAQAIIRDTIQDLIREGFLTAKETDTKDDVLIRRQRAHRIVLGRLERAQVVMNERRWVSPLSPYYKMRQSAPLESFKKIARRF